MSICELKGVSKSYGSGNNITPVLKNVNLSVEEGEFVAIVGFSGSGKTTLISLLAGLLEADDGSLLFKGKPIQGTCLLYTSPSPRDLSTSRMPSSA